MNKKLISFMTMTSILLSSLASSNAMAKAFNSKTNVDLSHKWTVQFSHPLATSQDFSKITITDSTGNTIPVTVNLGTDKTSLTIQPNSQYAPNTTYQLKVDGIKDVNNKQLSDNATMQFTTTNSSTPTPTPTPQQSIISPEYLPGAEGKADLTFQALKYSEDSNGNKPDIDEYEKGIVYTSDQVESYFPGKSIKGIGTNKQIETVQTQGVAFSNEKVYKGVYKPFRQGDGIQYRKQFAWVKEYTNPINSYAEKQMYTTVSNAEKLNETTPTYSLAFNDKYWSYADDGTGKLVQSKDSSYGVTCEYITLETHADLWNNNGTVNEYGTVFFIETPFVKNNISYNLKMDLYFNSEASKNGAKFLLTSCVGSKLGYDIYNTLAKNATSTGGQNDANYVIDGVNVCTDHGDTYIQLQ